LPRRSAGDWTVTSRYGKVIPSVPSTRLDAD
jgi:hypothetical protein